jgi:hypothetical protein
MIQRGEDFGFALEPCDAIGVVDERVGQDFQRDIAIQLRIAGAIDLTHAAGSDGGEDLVWSEPGAGLKSHR